MNALRLFCASAAARTTRWTRSSRWQAIVELPRGRPARSAATTCTSRSRSSAPARPGSSPRIAAALRAAAAGRVGRPCSRSRATARRAASACSSSTTTARATAALAGTSTAGSSGSASTGASAARGSRTSPSLRFRDRPRLRPAPPDLGAFVPSDAAVYHSVLRPRRGAVRGPRNGCARRLMTGGSRAGTRRRARPDRAAVRQGLGHEDERPGAGRRSAPSRPGSLSLDLALGIGGLPRGRDRRGLRPGVVGQDDARLPRDRRGPAPRRHLRLHRRRARDGSRLREADRRQHRRAARLAARHGRAGARDRRAARPLRARSTSSRSTPSPR